MAATNFTPIQLYFSTTASAVPLAANLAQGELAINITDGKLYYEDNAGVVQVIATKGAGTIGGSNTQIQYNNNGALAGNAAMTFNSATSTTTLTTLNLTNALGAIYGGTSQSSYTQGDILYSSATNTLAKLGIGTVNFILTSTGSVPQWVAPTSITVQTANNLAGGAAGSVPYQSAIDTTTFLAIGATNRVMTSTGSAPQWVTALTGLTGVSSSSITNTSLTSGRVVLSTTAGLQADSANLTFNGTTLSATGFSTTGLSTLVQTVTIGNSNFSGSAVFAAATPAKLYIGTGTVTDTTSAIGATNATGAISSLAITPIAASNTSVTYTNASTLYIAGAPSAGTNITITNPYSLYVNAGTAYFADNVGIGISSPARKLQVNSGEAVAARFTRGGGIVANNSLEWFDGTNGWYAGVSGSNFWGVAYNSSGGIDSAAIRLDSAGNLGLGVTPVATWTGYKVLQAGIASFAGGSGGAYLIQDNLYTDSTGSSWKYIANNYAAAQYFAAAGAHVWRTAPNNGGSQAGTTATLTTSMTLDASGRLGVGTTSPLTGLTLIKYGTQWTNHSTNTYPQPAGNTFLQMEAQPAQANWFGFTGSYGATSGSANLLLQVNLNNTSQQAGNYIASEAQSATDADLTFGKMIGGATTGANSTKSEQMRLSSAGNLQLLSGGTWATSAGGLQLSMNGNDGYITTYFDTHTVTLGAGVSLKNRIKVAGSGGANNITFFTNNSQGMTLDASGRLLIGGTSTYDFNGQANLVVNGTSGLSTIVVASPDIGYFVFADGTTGTDRYAGNITYNHSSNSMLFGTNGIFNRVCIDSSGNLGVGTTSPNGRIEAVAAANTDCVLRLNTATNAYASGVSLIATDSNGARFNFVNASYGATENWYIGGNGVDKTLVFRTDSTERARFNSTGAFVLAGGTTTANGIGITFPATQSASSDANTLDDYEEGTWTPTLTTAGTAPTGIGYSFRGATYTKIGNTVICKFGFKLNAVSSVGTGEITVIGLPFTPAAYPPYEEPPVTLKCGYFASSSVLSNGIAGYVPGGGAQIFLRTGNVDSAVPAAEITSLLAIGATIIYQV
jgi:hypothetical protein